MLLGSEREAGGAKPAKTKLKLRMGAPAVGASGWELQAGAAGLAGAAVGGKSEDEGGRPKRLTVRLGGAGGVLAAAQRRRLEQDEVRHTTLPQTPILAAGEHCRDCRGAGRLTLVRVCSRA